MADHNNIKNVQKKHVSTHVFEKHVNTQNVHSHFACALGNTFPLIL